MPRETWSAYRLLIACVLLVGAFYPIGGRFAVADEDEAASPIAASPMTVEEELAVSKEVDRLLVEETGGAEARRSELADDETFLRRVSLDLVGEAPTPEEIIAFSLDASESKRTHKIRELIDDPRFGQNWASYWRDVILFRRTADRALLAAPAMTTFLTEALNEGRPWNEVAAEFIRAEGDIREVGATGLIMAHQGEPEDVVSEISRIFLGIQIQCAQCHDHPTDRWKREQFHELAAFFPRVAVRPDRSAARPTFLVFSNDRPRRKKNENNRYVGSAEHYMPDLEDPSAEGKLMKPVFFVSGESLELGATDAQRRSKLTEWITAKENPWFAKAFVNRVWAEMVGEGFYEPVDDMGPDRAASAPNTLDYLSQSFAESDYDVKRLYRVIASTEAYQRASQSRRSADGVPFLANCAQRLRGDQLYDALLKVLGKTDALRQAGPSRPMAYNRGQRGVFLQEFGYDPSERKDDLGGSLPQALAMMNSEIVTTGTTAKSGSKLARLLASIPDNDSLVVELYLQALARQPSAKELQTCLLYVNNLRDRQEAFEDIMWALVNSTEFLHRK